MYIISSFFLHFDVVGSPIEVSKKTEITQKDVDELHEKYVTALSTLYNMYSEKFAKGIKLEIN
jgi:hypothetical protein